MKNAENIMEATKSGNLALLKYLITTSKVNQDMLDKILWTAVLYNYEEIVKYIIDLNANVNKNKSSITSPLVLAATNGYYNIVKLLVENGATDLDLALLAAASKGHFIVVRYLVTSGAKSINQAYFYAVANSRYKTTEYLLLSKADVNYQNALFNAAQRGFTDIVKLLVKYNANVNIFVGNTITHSPISIAASKGYKEIVRFLLDNGAIDLNNALCKAKENNHEEIVGLLKNKGAKIIADDIESDNFEINDNELRIETDEEYNQRMIRILKFNKIDVEKIISPYTSNNKKIPSILVLFEALPQNILERGNPEIKAFVLKIIGIVKQTFKDNKENFDKYIKLNDPWFSQNKNSLLWFKRCFLIKFNKRKDGNNQRKVNSDDLKLARKKKNLVPDNF